MLFLMIEYYFSLIGYFWLYTQFPAGECASTLGCFLTVIDKGFKEGNIGLYMDENTENIGSTVGVKDNRNNIDYLRLFYDNFFNVIVMIIMMNIV